MNFKNHMYSKKVKLKDAQGVEEEYEFVALGGKHLPKLYSIAKQFSGLKKDSSEEEVMEKMEEGTIEDMVTLLKEMIKKSYPSITDDECDSFVQAHFSELVPLLFEINIK